MKIFLCTLLTCLVIALEVDAQYASQKNASYLAIIKAVSDYKINDEEYTKDLEKLRENKKFNEKLNKIIAELSNSKNKDSDNKKVLTILLNAGKEIDNALNVR